MIIFLDIILLAITIVGMLICFMLLVIIMENALSDLDKIVMKDFLEQLGFKDITPDNPLELMYSLTEFFDWYQPTHSLYCRTSDNGIITYIVHGSEGDMHYIAIVSKKGYKWTKAHQLAPSKYIKNVTFYLLTSTEASVLRL